MDSTLIWTMIAGSLRDPILWILAAVIGWDHTRAASKTVGFLVTAGCLWGAIRVAIYMAYGEQLGLPRAAQIMLICVLLMVAAGMAVREGRWLFAKR